MTRAYTNFANKQNAPTPQSQPIPGREAVMTPNNAGGFGFVLDDWERLNRFLILGSEGGTYYVKEGTLTEQNAQAAIRCIKADGQRVARMAYQINVDNRAPKVDQQLFVMALILKHGDLPAKKAVEMRMPEMLRTGTHVLRFAAMLDGLGGWNRTKRRIIANWFQDCETDKLAYQVLKYQNRDSWRMLDLLRVSHPSAPSLAHAEVYNWIRGKTEGVAVNGVPIWPAALPDVLKFHLEFITRRPEGLDPVTSALRGIDLGLPREALPTEALNNPKVWAAMLPDMPVHALLRNLGNLSKHGVTANGTPGAALAAQKLRDAGALKKARVHPFAVLLAALVYRSGKGIKGSSTWSVTPAIMAALEDAYDAAFTYTVPTGKRILVGVDTSGSMSQMCVGSPISTATAAQAVAITLARLEPNAVVVDFATAVQRIVPVTPRTGIASLQENTSGGGTDVGAPIWWALGEKGRDLSRTWGGSVAAPTVGKQVFDAFTILTDNETWAGSAHPSQLLARYRREVNPAAKLICCSMAANHANIVDSNDPLSLGCAGLDANLPVIVSDFIGR